MEIKNMNSNSQNPLAKHFRQPAIYLKLPSMGSYWPEDALRLPVNGELAIYPMTTKDEITLRTPDALMNGSGVIDVIKSCVPDILDPWKMPSVDVDAVIIAIRIASYGHRMDFNRNCPSCSETHDYAVDLRMVLERLRMPEYTDTLDNEGLTIKFKPLPYFNLNQDSIMQFEQQRMLQAIEATEVPAEQRAEEIKKHMERILDLTAESMASATEYIQTAEGDRVTERDFILEYYRNSSSSVTKAITEHLAKLNEQGSVQPVDVNCESCNHPFQIRLDFDYSSFFAKGF